MNNNLTSNTASVYLNTEENKLKINNKQNTILSSDNKYILEYSLEDINNIKDILRAVNNEAMLLDKSSETYLNTVSTIEEIKLLNDYFVTTKKDQTTIIPFIQTKEDLPMACMFNIKDAITTGSKVIFVRSFGLNNDGILVGIASTLK